MAAFDVNPVVAVLAHLVRAEPTAVAGAVRVVGHHALGEEALEGLGHPEAPDVLQRPCPETRVEQVKDRVLDAANILADGKPRFCLRAVERPGLWLAGKANEVPGRIDERVERIRLAPRRAATAWT